MYRRIKIILAVFLLAKVSVGQISEGGMPLELPLLKSKNVPVVLMPRVLDDLNGDDKSDESSLLKPFRFAHGFEVTLSPSNSGIWLKTPEGINIWALKIHSVNAKSLNLIFKSMHLSRGGKLFLYNDDKSALLGAFTSQTVLSDKFATLPLPGETIIIQYELPESYGQPDDFTITEVNHDYVGILKSGERRPMGIIAGECNLDANCSRNKYWQEIKNSVCRLIVNGKEICTGTLMNNTAENGVPYVLSAAHCYDKPEYAQTTVFTFNYESPFCAPIDGDPSNSLSGAVLKASFDSLDFALVQLNQVPPPEFGPYYAGWDRTTGLPDSSATIHHPQGDIKKITIDQDQPSYADFSSGYLRNSFYKISRWESGVTESGSSGAALFNQKKKVIGTLTGGVADCSNPVRDYFARFDLAWNYRPETSKQLKYWLDPLNSGVKIINGRQLYPDTIICSTYSNLRNNDTYQKVKLVSGGQFKGYWGGSNSENITEFVEKFTVSNMARLKGISLGVAKAYDKSDALESEITIKVYSGLNQPENELYSSKIKIRNLYSDAINHIYFNQALKPGNNFFVGFALTNIQPLDSFYIYQSLRPANGENTFYYRQSGNWVNFKSANTAGNAMANICEILVCGLETSVSDTSEIVVNESLVVYPNPATGRFYVSSNLSVLPGNIAVYNVMGKRIQATIESVSDKKALINLTGNVPGIYFVRLKQEDQYSTRKLLYMPE